MDFGQSPGPLWIGESGVLFADQAANHLFLKVPSFAWEL